MKKKLCVLICGLATTSLLFTGCGSASTGSEQPTVAADGANMDQDAKQPGDAPEGEESTEMMNEEKPADNKEKNAENVKIGTITEISEDSISIEAMAGDNDMNKPSMEKPDENGAPQGEPPQGGAPSGDKPDGNGGPQKDAPAGEKPDGNNAPQDVKAEELTFTITDDTVFYSEGGETITVDELAEGMMVSIETDDDNNAVSITTGMPEIDEKSVQETETTESETETEEN